MPGHQGVNKKTLKYIFLFERRLDDWKLEKLDV
jgi:hypothetical protein